MQYLAEVQIDRVNDKLFTKVAVSRSSFRKCTLEDAIIHAETWAEFWVENSDEAAAAASVDYTVHLWDEEDEYVFCKEAHVEFSK